MKRCKPPADTGREYPKPKGGEQMGYIEVRVGKRLLFADFDPAAACRHWLEAKKRGLNARISCQSSYALWQIKEVLAQCDSLPDREKTEALEKA